MYEQQQNPCGYITQEIQSQDLPIPSSFKI